MTATVIDGKAFAARVRAQVAAHVARLREEHGIVPGLAVVLVGEDPASQVYVAQQGHADRRGRHGELRAQARAADHARRICWR